MRYRADDNVHLWSLFCIPFQIMDSKGHNQDKRTN